MGRGRGGGVPISHHLINMININNISSVLAVGGWRGRPRAREPALRAQRLKKFKILKFSSEIENFKRTAHQIPIFVENSEGQD